MKDARTVPRGGSGRKATPLPNRVWRSFKYEDVYLKEYVDGIALQAGANAWFADYNHERPHQALNYATPADLYFCPDAYGAKPPKWIKQVGLQEIIV